MRSIGALLLSFAAAAVAAPPSGMPPVMPAGAATVEVDIPALGKVEGFVNTLQGQDTWQFRGLPYAQPPVGPLRWQSPQPIPAWNGVYNGTNDAPGCAQDCYLPHGTCPQVTSEDCLYLNVYTPAGAKSTDKMPVAIWIHGGNFKQGYSGGFLYDGSVMASTHKVVVVTINYRLGSLGFMYTGIDTSIQGMYGIEDQRMAMKWVNENIAAFGGDKDAVTLYGQSAGAMSIATHMSLDASEPYYHRTILQSEPFSLPFRHAEEMVDLAEAFGIAAGCTGGEPDFDECVRALDTKEVIAAQVKAEVNLFASLGHLLEVFQPWTPLINPRDPTRALQMMPLDYFTKGLAHDKPMILGTVENEAIPFIYMAFTKPTGEQEYVDVLDAIFAGNAKGKLIRERYPLPADQEQDTRRHMSLLGTRELFVCPVRNATRGFVETRQSSVWQYHFDEVWSFGKAGWGPEYECCWDFVCHGAGLPFTFQPDPAEFGISPPLPEEYNLMHRLMAHWANFMRTGNPNSPMNATLSYWPAFNTTAEPWKRFQLPNDVVQYRNYTAECDWWTDNIGYHIY